MQEKLGMSHETAPHVTKGVSLVVVKPRGHE